MVYLTEEEYRKEYSEIPADALQKRLKQGSRNIDLLTFNRIVKRGFDALTDYQKEIVKECCAEIANFYEENDDMIRNVLSSYSINGVSMSFGTNWNLRIINGVVLLASTYEKLSTTGLCCRSLRC